MLKKMLFAGAVVAIAALSPAIASATWFMEGKALTKNESLQMKGEFGFEGELGGLTCKIVAEATLQAGTTTGQTQFAVDGTPTNVCKTHGLLSIAGCKVETGQVTSLPWTLHKTATETMQMTTGSIHYTLVQANGKACTRHTITLNPGIISIQVPAAEMNAISKATAKGNLESSMGEVLVEHIWTVTPSGTFGL